MAIVSVTREASAMGRLMRAVVAAAPVCAEFELDPQAAGEAVGEVLDAAADCIGAVEEGATSPDPTLLVGECEPGGYGVEEVREGEEFGRVLCECGHPTPEEALVCARPRSIEGLAQRAFAAYNAHAGGLTWDGKPIPPWESVGDAVRSHWRAAAEAVRKAVKP